MFRIHVVLAAVKLCLKGRDMEKGGLEREGAVDLELSCSEYMYYLPIVSG